MLARAGQRLGAGVNKVGRDGDPFAHAEVIAILDACTPGGPVADAGGTCLPPASLFADPPSSWDRMTVAGWPCRTGKTIHNLAPAPPTA